VDSSLVVLGSWRLLLGGNADWDESKAEHAIWKTGYGVDASLAIVDQSAPRASEAEVGRGHVLIEPLVYFFLTKWDDHRVGVNAESCVGVRGRWRRFLPYR